MGFEQNPSFFQQQKRAGVVFRFFRMGIFGLSEEPQNSSYLNIFWMCMCILSSPQTQKVERFMMEENETTCCLLWNAPFQTGYTLGGSSAVTHRLVSAPVYIWKLSQPLVVGERFNSEDSVLQFNVEKVGSKAADNLQLPLTYALVPIHPCRLTRAFLVKVVPSACVHAWNTRAEADKSLPGAPSINSRKGYTCFRERSCEILPL